MPKSEPLSTRSDAIAPPPAFHSGEVEIQQALGVAGELERRARKVVRDHLPDQHRRFYAGLPFVVAAARDVSGRPWATLLAGPPGFVASPSPTELSIDAGPTKGDPLEDALEPGSDLGLLGIDLARRRRNRANGRVAARGDRQIAVQIDQTFGNCPQFIWPRDWEQAPPSEDSGDVRHGSSLEPSQIGWIENACTFFVASGYRGDGDAPSFGMDASHRGGPAGFVDVVDGRTLRFPDYAGNDHFNTFGNLIRDPRIGLVFPDFERGGLLQLTGVASIDWTRPDQSLFPNAERLVEVRIDAVVDRAGVLPIRWQRAAKAGA